MIYTGMQFKTGILTSQRELALARALVTHNRMHARTTTHKRTKCLMCCLELSLINSYKNLIIGNMVVEYNVAPLMLNRLHNM